MSNEGLLVGLMLLLACLAWVAVPFFRRDASRTDQERLLQKHRDRLLMVYERVLTNIRDLDEDHSTGKMNDSDYQTERETWVGRGIQVLKALDHLNDQVELAPIADDQSVDSAIDDQIEAAIARYRAKAGEH